VRNKPKKWRWEERYEAIHIAPDWIGKLDKDENKNYNHVMKNLLSKELWKLQIHI
jgi:hypothetical protein